MRIAGFIASALGLMGVFNGNGYGALWIGLGVFLLNQSGFFDQTADGSPHGRNTNLPATRNSTPAPEPARAIDHLL